MNRIDSYVEALFQRGAQRLIVASGEKLALAFADGVRPLTAAAPPAKLVDQMLREIAPAELAAEIGQDGEHGFEYRAPAGPVQVSVRRRRDALRLEIAPLAAAAAPRPSAPFEASAPPVRAQAGPAARAAAPPVDDDADTRVLGRAAAALPDGAREAMDALFHEMVREGCSDLHLSTGNPPLFRKDGSIVRLSHGSPLGAERLRDMLYAITPPARREEFEARCDSDFSYEIPGLARFRCNLFMDRTGIGGVFRVIPSDILTAEALGLSSAILDLCRLSKGLVVVTGPTGSGKSTTLAAMIDFINRQRAEHIITIEDPIEFVHPNKKCLINQREIGSHTAGFKSALRAALREDPDIVLVGEMRDLETVEIAIETAETGHLVFGTLHTNTAASTVDRVIDQFPTDRQGQIRTMLAESLKGVIAQTLCKKKGGGRVAALEVLIANAAVSNLIREGKTFQITSIMQTGKKLGMVTLNDALLELVTKGLVEPEQAYAKAVARAEFRSLLQGRGIKLDVAPEPQ